jgi:hypothetical protein
MSLVLRGSEQLGPNGLSGEWSRTQAEATRNERHGKSNPLSNGSSAEAGKTKMAKLETTSADNTTAQRKEGNGSGNSSAAGGSSDNSSNGGASSAGREKEIGGGGKGQGVLT